MREMLDSIIKKIAAAVVGRNFLIRMHKSKTFSLRRFSFSCAQQNLIIILVITITIILI